MVEMVPMAAKSLGGAYDCQIPGRGEDVDDVSWLMMK
jgi:hypothetical protein